jgi:hypothetical protein
MSGSSDAAAYAKGRGRAPACMTTTLTEATPAPVPESATIWPSWPLAVGPAGTGVTFALPDRPKASIILGDVYDGRGHDPGGPFW